MCNSSYSESNNLKVTILTSHSRNTNYNEIQQCDWKQITFLCRTCMPAVLLSHRLENFLNFKIKESGVSLLHRMLESCDKST